jgi:hypothetical protein
VQAAAEDCRGRVKQQGAAGQDGLETSFVSALGTKAREAQVRCSEAGARLCLSEVSQGRVVDIGVAGIGIDETAHCRPHHGRMACPKTWLATPPNVLTQLADVSDEVWYVETRWL